MSLREGGRSLHRARTGRKTRRIRCGELGEDRLLGQLLSRLSIGKGVINGPGDDCAVVDFGDHRNLLVLKTDCVVAGVHFLPTANALDVGWKAMMRPLSDFAATSAVPQFALITLIVPQQTKVEWVEELYRGLRRAAKRFKVSIVGGETSSTSGPVAISVSVVGYVERDRRVSRQGGEAGDDLLVTGRLGSAVRKRHLQFIPRIVESRWLTRNFRIHAMMDLSDGLGADLPRLARASRVGFTLKVENLPLARDATIDSAISEGEDYELLFAISPRERNRLEREWRKKFPKLMLTRIGLLSQPSTKNDQLLPRGYVHFQQSG
jgi:thiamine-monophosphate kinase